MGASSNRMEPQMNRNATEPRRSHGKNDEPELTQEESIPSDGKDHEGEQLMEQLGPDWR